ncbi:hypothetical protein BH10PSE13_BH10PSE13_25210 [soil metagenome]
MISPIDRRFTPLALAPLCAIAALMASMPAEAKEGDAPTLQQAIGNPANFRLSGSTRLRYEALGGQTRVGFAESEDVFSIRTTLAGEYRTGNVRIGAEMYDSRTYGIATGSSVGTGEVNTFELVQAYLTVDFPEAFGKGSRASMQAGRMMLNIGSRRLIAADDYRNTTNGYTGIKLDAKLKDGSTATLLYVLPQLRLPDDISSIKDNRPQVDRESFDMQLWGGLLAKPRVLGRTMAEIGYVGFAERDAPGRPTRDRHLQSISARLMADPAPKRWDFEVEGIYQFGSSSSSLLATAPRQDVSAWFLHADLGYSFPGSLKARLSVEYDYVSGDGPDGANGRFDTLFGMRRGDFVPAGIYSQIHRANISTPGLRLEVAPTKRLDGFATYRPMWLADRFDAFSTTGVRDATGRSGDFAGHTIEGRTRWWVLPKALRAEVNGAWMIKGQFLKTAPNAPRTGNTRYISVAIIANF